MTFACLIRFLLHHNATPESDGSTITRMLQHLKRSQSISPNGTDGILNVMYNSMVSITPDVFGGDEVDELREYAFTEVLTSNTVVPACVLNSTYLSKDAESAPHLSKYESSKDACSWIRSIQPPWMV